MGNLLNASLTTTFSLVELKDNWAGMHGAWVHIDGLSTPMIEAAQELIMRPYTNHTASFALCLWMRGAAIKWYDTKRKRFEAYGNTAAPGK